MQPRSTQDNFLRGEGKKKRLVSLAISTPLGHREKINKKAIAKIILQLSVVCTKLKCITFTFIYPNI